MPIHGSFGDQHLEPLENVTFRRISRTTGHSNTLCLSTEWWLVVSDGYIQTTWVHHWPKVPNFCDVQPWNNLPLYPFPNWHTSETFSEKSSLFFRRKSTSPNAKRALFVLHVPTARNDWSRMVFNERCPTSSSAGGQSKVGRPLSPIGFRGSKLLSSVTSLWPDSMMSELVLCLPKAVDQILWTCVYC